MFLGDVKVDSIIYRDSVRLLYDSTQLTGIEVSSDTLLGIFSEAKVYRILKLVPTFEPSDTLYWDSIRIRWHTLPDLSKYYEIAFPGNLDIDSLANRLRMVPGLDYAKGIEIPVKDNPCTLFVPNDPHYSSEWHLGVRDSVSLEGGAGVTCAWGLLIDHSLGNTYVSVLDDGIYTSHEDLDAKFVGGFGETTCSDSQDLCGHGTGVAGIIGAETDNGIGVAGVAPDAHLISWDIGDTNSYNGYTGAVADIWLAIDETPTAVMNYSYHFMTWDNAFFDALVHAKAHSIPVIVSAGNFSGPVLYPPQTDYPAAWDSLVITVGAHGYPGNVPPWSNYPCDTCPMWLDVVAPGVSLPTTSSNGSYGFFGGTSASAPVVAGIITLARAYKFSLTPEVLEVMLEQTADSGLDVMGAPEQAQGHGGVNAYKFIDRVINTSAGCVSNLASTTDSVPCLIITDLVHKPFLQPLADKKIKRGTNTKIEVINHIFVSYPGRDFQERIRACIIDYYTNKHLEYVILGGDGSIVPFRYAYSNLYGPGVNAISDYYYACLDGDWNLDDDTLWGEMEDSVDLVPEVAVGRLPFSTSEEFNNFLAKLETYESGIPSDWQATVAAIGSEMFYPTDGKEMCQNVLGLFPSGFPTTELYDDTATTDNRDNFINLLNTGYGLVVAYGLAAHSGNFCVKRRNPYTFVDTVDIDTLSNVNMPSVIYAATCWNQKYDEDCMAYHYMAHPTGGAIAYVGTTYNDFVRITDDIAATFFGHLFGNGPAEIGNLLNTAKQVMVSNSDWDGPDRHSVFGYSLSGDPQMRIWTTEPAFMAATCPASLEMGVRSFSVTITSQGNPVESSLVCVSMGLGEDVYELEYTDANGVASFNSVDFPVTGQAFVVASKHNLVDVEDTIQINPHPSGCPMLYVQDGGEYILINNILAPSEDPSLAGQAVEDCYPIYDLPVGNGGVLSFKISEDESEQTHLDALSVDVISYESDKEVAYTNKGEFRYLFPTSLTPESAVDENGSDILSLISSLDGKCYSSEVPGYIIVSYEFPQALLKQTGDDPGGGIDPGGDDKNHYKVVTTSIANSGEAQNVEVSVRVPGGSWETIDTRYPRVNKFRRFTDLSGCESGGLLTVRISWENKISIDALPYMFFDGNPITGTQLQINSAQQTGIGNISSLITSADGSQVELNPGESIEIELNQIAPQLGRKMAAMLKFIGHYETIASTGGSGIVFEQNYPNPFNPTTTFAFSLPNSCHVNLSVYNVLGQKVTSLIDGYFSAGRHTATWDGTDENDKRVASGVYFSKFKAGDYHAQKKLVIVK